MIDVLLAVASYCNEFSGMIGQELSVLIQLEVPQFTTIALMETMFFWRNGQVSDGASGYGWAGTTCPNLNHSG